jgi:lantibiotic modifying enzyme
VDAVADVAARLRAMSEDDLRWQQRLIRSAIAARAYSGGRSEGAEAVSVGQLGPAGRMQPAAGAALRSAVAQRIHVQVLADALRTGSHLTWMTLGLLNDGDHANVQRIGSGLYDGVLGIGIFLYQRGEHEAARAALDPMLTELAAGDTAGLRRQMLTVGLGFGGVGGYLRGLRWLQRQGQLPDAQADKCVAAVIGALTPAAIAGDRWLDVMNGTAGVLIPLAGESGGHVAELIAAAADRLVAQQRPDGGWLTLPARAPLTGYAHGAAGIAVALVAAHRVLGEDGYLDAALRALAYEAGTFDSDAGNWPDFRDGSGGGFMLGWCAGAPGIALARATLMRMLPDHPAAATWEQEVEAAARTIATAPLQPRDHVCCGNLGRAVILHTLGVQFRRDDWLAAADQVADAVAARAGDGVPRSFLGASAPDVLAVPGLMTGLAGSGLALGTADPASWVEALLR